MRVIVPCSRLQRQGEDRCDKEDFAQLRAAKVSPQTLSCPNVAPQRLKSTFVNSVESAARTMRRNGISHASR